jgi:hypothetical protein
MHPIATIAISVGCLVHVLSVRVQAGAKASLSPVGSGRICEKVLG